MTATEYRAALAALGLTQAGAAALMDLTTRTSNAYANGKRPIPKLVELYLTTQTRMGVNMMGIRAPSALERR